MVKPVSVVEKDEDVADLHPLAPLVVVMYKKLEDKVDDPEMMFG